MASDAPFHVATRREQRRRARFRVWNRIVLVIGYGTIGYGLARGVIFLLVLAKDWTAK